MWLRLQILYWCFVRIVKWYSRDLNSVVTERATTASLELLAIAVQVKPGFSEITDQECRALISWNISNVLFPQKCLQDFPPVTKYNTVETDQGCAVKQSSFIAPSFRQNECVLLLSFKAEVICFFSYPVLVERRSKNFILFINTRTLLDTEQNLWRCYSWFIIKSSL